MKIYYSASWEDYDIIDFKIGLLKSYFDWRNKKFDRPEKCDSFFLDCGAFSAWTRDTTIDLNSYMEYIKENESQLDVYAALDDISSYEISLKNYDIMRKGGLEPLPAFHYKEPMKVLEEYLQHTNYIALGGIAKVPKRERMVWLDKVFSKYPNVSEVGFHGFGIQDETLLKRYPWKSVDASSWHVMARYGGIYFPGNIKSKKVSRAIKVSSKVNSYELEWITPQAEQAMRDWVESLGFDYDVVKEGTVEGTKTRMAINIIYFEKLAKEVPTEFKGCRMKGLFV